MNCPRCHTESRKRGISTVEVDECPQCKGLWFGKDELRKAKDQTDADLRWMDFELWKHQDRFHVAAKPVRCPACDVPMAAVTYDKTDIEVDCCPKCWGVWLDGGEFEKIIDALGGELESLPASKYVRASLEEAREILTGPEGFISEWRDFLTVIRMMEYRILSENPKLHQAIRGIQESSPM